MEALTVTDKIRLYQEKQFMQPIRCPDTDCRQVLLVMNNRFGGVTLECDCGYKTNMSLDQTAEIVQQVDFYLQNKDLYPWIE